MQAVVIHQHGDPDVLRLEDVPVPEPGRDQVLVHNQAIGVSFVDTQHRSGQNYPVGLPLIPGIEAAGIVARVGADVADVSAGDRVAYAGYMGGNYAEYTAVAADRLIPVPEQISFEQAAAGLVQGMTAHCLTESVYSVRDGDTALVQAAASGVGLCLVQLAKRRGAVVIGTVSSAAKAALAKDAGADHVIVYTEQDFAAATMTLTNNQGVNVIYDAVGRTTFDRGISVLKPQGYMVVYGLSSGAVPPFDINRLSGITGSGNNGSLFLTWATLSDYTRTRADLLWRARDVFAWIADGTLSIPIARTMPLANAADAHRLVESRDVLGKIVLRP